MNIKKSLILPAMVLGSVGVGVGASSMIAGSGVSADTTAATTASTAAANTAAATTSTNSSTTPPAQQDKTKGGHTANGITETLLTGDTATKAKAAAEAAVSGATVDRVENDAEGATYEAHMTKADGTQVNVKMDANFTVTSTEDGPGGAGGPAAGASSQTSTN